MATQPKMRSDQARRLKRISGRPPRDRSIRSEGQYSTFHALIRHGRNRLGATTTELAQMIGTGAGRVYDWESGLRFPQRKHLAGLSDAIDVELTGLILFRIAARADRVFRRGAPSLDALHRAIVVLIEGEADLRPRGSR